MPEPVEQAQAPEPVEPPPHDLWTTEPEIAAARVLLARLDQHARAPGLARFMVPLEGRVPPSRGTCQACGMAGLDRDARWGHAVARHAEGGRLRCVRWALGIPEPSYPGLKS